VSPLKITVTIEATSRIKKLEARLARIGEIATGKV